MGRRNCEGKGETGNEVCGDEVTTTGLYGHSRPFTHVEFVAQPSSSHNHREH